MDIREVMCITKVLSSNLRTLHHNIAGGTWFGIHNLLSDYYEKMDDIQDDVVEAGILLGFTEPTLAESVTVYQEIPTDVLYSIDKALEFTYNFFTDLISAFEALKDTIPGDVYANFETYIYYLRKEAEYKIKHKLMKFDDFTPFNNLISMDDDGDTDDDDEELDSSDEVVTQ